MTIKASSRRKHVCAKVDRKVSRRRDGFVVSGCIRQPDATHAQLQLRSREFVFSDASAATCDNRRADSLPVASSAEFTPCAAEKVLRAAEIMPRAAQFMLRAAEFMLRAREKMLMT